MTSIREIHPAEADLETKRDDYYRAEIDKVIKGLNNYKVPGFDYNEIAQAIKNGGDELAARLLQPET